MKDLCRSKVGVLDGGALLCGRTLFIYGLLLEKAIIFSIITQFLLFSTKSREIQLFAN